MTMPSCLSRICSRRQSVRPFFQPAASITNIHAASPAPHPASGIIARFRTVHPPAIRLQGSSSWGFLFREPIRSPRRRSDCRPPQPQRPQDRQRQSLDPRARHINALELPHPGVQARRARDRALAQPRQRCTDSEDRSQDAPVGGRSRRDRIYPSSVGWSLDLRPRHSHNVRCSIHHRTGSAEPKIPRRITSQPAKPSFDYHSSPYRWFRRSQR
jgi:hypothetical protein